MSTESFPVSLEEALISIDLNSTILEVLLWGIYSVVYTGTLYIYLTKKSSRSQFIVGAITVSYITYSTDTILSWYLSWAALIKNSETRDTVFAALELGPQWPSFATDVINFVMAAVADGILIWRCFHVWGRSLRAILLPSILLFCEIVLDLTILTYEGVKHFNFSDDQAVLADRLISAQVFITFATTLTATLFISHRIYRILTGGRPIKSKEFFKHTVEILIQSSAAYSLAALLYAIFFVIPVATANLVWVDAVQTYTSLIFLFTAGVAPMIMVARIAFQDDRNIDPSTISMHVSELQFQVQSTAQGGPQSIGGKEDDEYGSPEGFPTTVNSNTKEGEIMNV